MPKSAPLRNVGGRLVSAKSRTGRSECSSAMSQWKTSGMTPQVAAILGKCRAIAHQKNRAAGARAAGNEAKAQHWEKNAERGMTMKARASKARELRAARAEKMASRTSAASTPAAAAASLPPKAGRVLRMPAVSAERKAEMMMKGMLKEAHTERERHLARTPMTEDYAAKHAQQTEGFNQRIGALKRATWEQMGKTHADPAERREAGKRLGGWLRGGRPDPADLRGSETTVLARHKGKVAIPPRPAAAQRFAVPDGTDEVYGPRPGTNAPMTNAWRSERRWRLAGSRPAGGLNPWPGGQQPAAAAPAAGSGTGGGGGFALKGGAAASGGRTGSLFGSSAATLPAGAKPVPPVAGATAKAAAKPSAYQAYIASGGKPEGWDAYREKANLASRLRGTVQIKAQWRSGQPLGGNDVDRYLRNRGVTLPDNVRRALQHDDTTVSATEVAARGLKRGEAAAVHRAVSQAMGGTAPDRLARAQALRNQRSASRPAPAPSPAPAADRPFALASSPGRSAGGKRFENEGAGRTGVMFDMKRGDLPGQTSLLDRVGTITMKADGPGLQSNAERRAAAVKATGRGTPDRLAKATSLKAEREVLSLVGSNGIMTRGGDYVETVLAKVDDAGLQRLLQRSRDEPDPRKRSAMGRWVGGSVLGEMRRRERAKPAAAPAPAPDRKTPRRETVRDTKARAMRAYQRMVGIATSKAPAHYNITELPKRARRLVKPLDDVSAMTMGTVEGDWHASGHQSGRPVANRFQAAMALGRRPARIAEKIRMSQQAEASRAAREAKAATAKPAGPSLRQQADAHRALRRVQPEMRTQLAQDIRGLRKATAGTPKPSMNREVVRSMTPDDRLSLRVNNLNYANDKANPPTPTLKEQAAAKRASKGTRDERLKKIGSVAYRRSESETGRYQQASINLETAKRQQASKPVLKKMEADVLALKQRAIIAAARRRKIAGR